MSRSLCTDPAVAPPGVFVLGLMESPKTEIRSMAPARGVYGASGRSRSGAHGNCHVAAWGAKLAFP